MSATLVQKLSSRNKVPALHLLHVFTAEALLVFATPKLFWLSAAPYQRHKSINEKITAKDGTEAESIPRPSGCKTVALPLDQLGTPHYGLERVVVSKLCLFFGRTDARTHGRTDLSAIL